MYAELKRTAYIEFTGLTEQILKLTEKQLVDILVNRRIVIDCITQGVPFISHIGKGLYIILSWIQNYQTRIMEYTYNLNLCVEKNYGMPFSFEQGITFSKTDTMIFYNILDSMKSYFRNMQTCTSQHLNRDEFLDCDHCNPIQYRHVHEDKL